MVKQTSRNTDNKNRHEHDYANISEEVQMCCHTDWEPYGGAQEVLREVIEQRRECINVATVQRGNKFYCDIHDPN